MKVLVTGGAGFVGTGLIKKLVERNCEVISIDDYSTGSPNNHIPGVTYITLDITENPFYLELGSNPSICFHLAALPRIQPSFNYPRRTYEVNTTGTISILEWCREKEVRKVVYAGSSSRWHDPKISPYANSKFLGEEVCKMYRNVYNMDIDITRFYNVYGPGEILDGDWAAVIGIFRRQVRDNQPLTIVGDGEQRRDFTHINDIADALARIGLQVNEKNQDWELGTGVNYSINEVYEMFRKKFNTTKANLPDQSGNYRETLRKTDKALEALGWNPSDQLQQYINSL